ncbi:MAG: hypothetical protein WC243_04700 [Patescibacteria group bacterium]
MRHLLVCAFLLFAICYLYKGKILAAPTENVAIPATVKISICGDGVAEGEEECDNDDLLGETCYTLGFGGGTVTCDPSCSLDTSLCIPVPPPDEDDDDEDDDDNVVEEIVQVVQNIMRPFTQLVSIVTLPDYLKVFDINSDGKVRFDELFDSARVWFDDWKIYLARNTNIENRQTALGLSCDLNVDGVCDLVDFSILMYHIDRT